MLGTPSYKLLNRQVSNGTKKVFKTFNSKIVYIIPVLFEMMF